MKKSFILLALCLAFGATSFAQSLEELKASKASKTIMMDTKKGEIKALETELASIQDAIHKLSGWRFGLSGLVGFNYNNSNGWIANPNPDASSSALNLGVTAFANIDRTKTFWNNKMILTKAWQDVNIADVADGVEDPGLFDQGTVDILNISSLAGYKLTDKFALSGMGELNTSLGNFLEPGTMDIGLGATWLPIENMTVVIHPLNYRYAFSSGLNAFESTGSIGAKVRVDYTRELMIVGKKVAWSSTLSSFIPYASAEGEDPSLFEYTWLNTLSFEVWRGIGVGVGFGVRDAEFESVDSQSYTSLGLTYGF